MSDLIPIKRALISVFDKSGLADFAKALHNELGVQLISTGGTARFLRELGLAVTDVSEVTGFPEMMDGRVKTLHPKIHGGLLAIRDNPEHKAAMDKHGIAPIDLVCINLYPFEKTISKPGVTFEEAIENIDIGGPSMVRSAAKNHQYVLIVTSPEQYQNVLADLRKNQGACALETRLTHAQAAFTHTAAYDGRISEYLASQINSQEPKGGTELPPALTLSLTKKQDLRYGENPHQKGALYIDRQPAEPSVAFAKQHHGKELSYINLLDADGALSAVREFADPAACIVKHTTPCGCAAASDLPGAFKKAYDGDPLAAFGGIVALNRTVDLQTAHAITSIDKLLEVIVAPDYTPDALDLLKSRWKNVRLLEVGPIRGNGQMTAGSGEFHMHRIVGGYLIQQRDLVGLDEANWKVASTRPPTAEEMDDLRFAWLVCKHVKSNAIVIAKDRMLLGAGAGQMDRPAAARLAIEKAGPRAKSAVAASDAFFPFPDGPELLISAGITAIIQPGGSLQDKLTVDLVNQRGVAMVFTEQRHFKH